MFLLERMKKNDRTNNSRVFVSYIRRYVLTNEFDNILVAFSGGKFSSPIFGDMFLLKFYATNPRRWGLVFVSYIRRYVLTSMKKATVML